jgi:hypothetical protein
MHLMCGQVIQSETILLQALTQAARERETKSGRAWQPLMMR